MKLVHTGVCLSRKKNVERFYGKLLGLEPEREYTVSRELMGTIFGTQKEAKVRLYSIGDNYVEVFYETGTIEKSLQHICIQVDDREELVSSALELNFRVLEKERENKANLIFVYDDDGNPYEIK